MATGRLPRGTLVEKINSEAGDGHQDGARGKVLGAVGIGYYFVEWEDKPGARWFVPETKLREVAAVRPGRKKK